MLDNALTTQLKTYLEMVREPIVLVPSPYRGDDAAKSSKSAHMDELLSEIAALSDKVSVGKPVDNERTPPLPSPAPEAPSTSALRACRWATNSPPSYWPCCR